MFLGTPTYDATKEFIEEFMMLYRLERHNNIVSLVGGVICDGEWLMCMKSCTYVSLSMYSTHCECHEPLMH